MKLPMPTANEIYNLADRREHRSRMCNRTILTLTKENQE